MNQRIKRLLLIPLAAAVFLSACSSQKNEPIESEAPMTLTLGYWDASTALAGDAMQQYIENKFNVELRPINVTYDNYVSQYQKLALDDNLPDLFAHDIFGSAVYEKWVQAGKIRPLPKDLSSYPNLEAYLSQPYNNRFRREDGFFYAIPRITYTQEDLWALDRCILLRKDWMEKLERPIPQSWEEFEALLEAFVTEDPDGNGVDDTAGLTSVNLNTLEALYLSEFPELSNTERGWLYEDGRWIPVYASQKTGHALKKVQDLYRKGLLDKDFAFSSTDENKQNFADGKVGAICMQYGHMLEYLNSVGKADLSDDIVCVLTPWPAPDGNRYRFTTSLHWSESYFGANVSNENMGKILEVIDWSLSEECNNAMSFGVPNVDWQEENGEPILLNKIPQPSIYYPSLEIPGTLAKWHDDRRYEQSDASILTYGQENVEYMAELMDWYQNNTQRVNYNYDIIFMSTPAKNSLPGNRVIQEEMVKVILGSETPVTAWPKALDHIREITPLDEAIREVNELAAEKGIEP